MQLQKRVENNRITEKEYRSLKQRLSYSALKQFSVDRRAFYKEQVLGEVSTKEETVSTILGGLVHHLLAEEEFDSKYHLSVGGEPKGQLLELCNNLYQRTLKSLDENGTQTETFEQLFMDAVNQTKYDYNMAEIAFKGKNIEKILELFTKPDKDGVIAEAYYKECLSSIGKTVVSINMVQNAEKLVEKVRNHPYTSSIVNQKSTDHVEIFTELPILFSIDGVEFKSMVDRLHVDHIRKVVTPYDYKVTWEAEGFSKNYLKMGYYIQVSLYSKAISEFCIEHNLEGYTVEPMKYIVLDTTGFTDPLIYECTEQDIIKGWEGFQIRGYKYKGSAEIISDISYHLGTGNWSSSKEAIENNGILPLEIAYQ